MGRLYDKHLPCGCLISSDSGGGVMPCYAEYGDMSKDEDRKQLELCNKSWDKWFKSKDYKEHCKEVARRNDSDYEEDELGDLIKEKLEKIKDEKSNKQRD